MSNPIDRLLQRHRLHGAVRQALESGTGLYHTTWRAGGASSDEVTAQLVAWCRESLSKMRRPCGVDNVSLAVCVIDVNNRQVASTYYALLRPADFYGAGPVESDARAVLRGWEEEGALSREGARISTVLFSWGDLTQELLLAG